MHSKYVPLSVVRSMRADDSVIVSIAECKRLERERRRGRPVAGSRVDFRVART